MKDAGKKSPQDLLKDGRHYIDQRNCSISETNREVGEKSVWEIMI